MEDEKDTEDHVHDQVHDQVHDHVHLKVVSQENAVVQFKIRRQTPLGKLMSAYCDRLGVGGQVLRFRFDGNPIGEKDTPATLAMQEGDTIEVYQQQIGGTHPAI